MKKGIGGLCVLALTAMLLVRMGALAQGTGDAWNEDGTVNTVIGKDAGGTRNNRLSCGFEPCGHV